MIVDQLNPISISPEGSARIRRRRALLGQTILCSAFFLAALAPVLSRPQFSGDSEDLVVQTALQMRHGGPWWVPVLGFAPRLKKPPLAPWIAALTVRPQTVALLSSIDPAVREQAYRALAWEVRWPALLAAGLTLAAIAWLARMSGGPAHVIPSVLICASTVCFLRFIRSITTDVHLLLWVTVANACFTALDLDIYLDRLVPDLSQWAANDGKWQAVVMLRKDDDPEHAVAGWRKLFDLQSRKHHWYVLVPDGQGGH